MRYFLALPGEKVYFLIIATRIHLAQSDSLINSTKHIFIKVKIILDHFLLNAVLKLISQLSNYLFMEERFYFEDTKTPVS